MPNARFVPYVPVYLSRCAKKGNLSFTALFYTTAKQNWFPPFMARCSTLPMYNANKQQFIRCPSNKERCSWLSVLVTIRNQNRLDLLNTCNIVNSRVNYNNTTFFLTLQLRCNNPLVPTGVVLWSRVRRLVWSYLRY